MWALGVPAQWEYTCNSLMLHITYMRVKVRERCECDSIMLDAGYMEVLTREKYTRDSIVWAIE